MTKPGESWRQHRIVPALPKRPATCARCDREFMTEFNPELRGDFGELIRGERQVFRLCVGCRGDDGFDTERARRTSAHAQS